MCAYVFHSKRLTIDVIRVGYSREEMKADARVIVRHWEKYEDMEGK